VTPESAIVVCVPEAESLVAPWRERYDPAAAAGVPAHVTLLYPFLRPDDISPDVERDLDALFAAVEPFETTFAAVGRFGDEVLFLDPAPDEPFRSVARRLCGRFGLAPYGGTVAIEEFKPHLTVADGHPEAFDEAHAAVARGLPIASRVAEAWILSSDATGRWTKRRRLVLGRS
jgi:2'-5' RNA ligase